jgi:hypothetical protein
VNGQCKLDVVCGWENRCHVEIGVQINLIGSNVSEVVGQYDQSWVTIVAITSIREFVKVQSEELLGLRDVQPSCEVFYSKIKVLPHITRPIKERE